MSKSKLVVKRLLPLKLLAERPGGAVASAWSTTEARRGGLRVEFRFPVVELRPVELSVGERQRMGFHRVEIEGSRGGGEAGGPELPVISRFVPIPEGYRASVRAEASWIKVLSGVRAAPCQAGLTDAVDDRGVRYDPKAYLAPAAHAWAEVSPPLDIGGTRVVQVTVRPTRYDPGSGKLEVAGVVRVELVWERLDQPARPQLAFDPDAPAFLVLYAKEHERAARRLAEWKNRRGLTTGITCVDDITNTVAGIKAHLRWLRLTTPLRYVLLLGDVDAIPTDSVGLVATDQTYTESSDWPSDHAFSPRLAIGRMPVRSAAQAELAVAKVINFERNPPANCDYYRRITVAGYFQDDDMDGQTDRGYLRTLEQLRDHLVGLGYRVDRVYVSNNPSPLRYDDGTTLSDAVKAAFVDEATATELLLAAANEGRLLFAHRDHGSPDGWWKPGLTSTDIDEVWALIPSNFFSINCSTGAFDDASSAESFAEKLLRLPAGVPSLVAATRVTDSGLNNDLTLGLCDGLWPGLLGAFPGDAAPYPVVANRLGDLLNYGKAYLQFAHPTWTTSNRDHALKYHVIGDPTLELWTQKPACLDMQVACAGSSMTIHLASLPVGTTITIWNKQEQVARLVPTSTTTTWALPFLLRVAGPALDVHVHAPGHLFGTVVAQVPKLELDLGPLIPERHRVEVRLLAELARARVAASV